MVWPDNDLLKFGLSCGSNSRDQAALQQIRRYFAHSRVEPGPFVEWRAEIPSLEGSAWGDCQRVEMVFGAVLQRNLGANAASAVGLEWLTRENLEAVSWARELQAAAVEALKVTGCEAEVTWLQYPGRAATPMRSDPGTTRRGSALFVNTTNEGEQVTGDQIERGEDVVYVTEKGTRFHRDKDCFAIYAAQRGATTQGLRNFPITAVPRIEAEQMSRTRCHFCA
jgi:hypothetical protein